MRRKIESSFSSLPLKARSLILGGLLGDGSLRINKGYKNPRYSFRHSLKQEEYFLWKVKLLESISSQKAITRRTDGFSKVEKLRFQSLATEKLMEIYTFCFKNNKFIIRRKWLNLLDSVALLVWWLDDGSIVARGKQGVLCTDGFSYEQNLILSKYLLKVWNIENKIMPNGKYYRILISKSGLESLLMILIKNLEVKSMIYKFFIRYNDPCLQQRWISKLASNSSFTIEQITEVFRERYSPLLC